MKRRLEGKVAIVTGGATGIGEAISKKFAKEGANVVVCGLPDDPVDDVVKAIQDEGHSAIAFKADISVPDNAEACVEKAVSEFKKLDILINNAGVFPTIKKMHEYPIEAYEYMI